MDYTYEKINKTIKDLRLILDGSIEHLDAKKIKEYVVDEYITADQYFGIQLTDLGRDIAKYMTLLD